MLKTLVYALLTVLKVDKAVVNISALTVRALSRTLVSLRFCPMQCARTAPRNTVPAQHVIYTDPSTVTLGVITERLAAIGVSGKSFCFNTML